MLNTFYDNLSEPGVREGADKAISKTDISNMLKEKGLTRQSVASEAGVAPMTVTAAAQGKKISLASADAIAKALNVKTNAIFKIDHDMTPLSSKTIIEYHRLMTFLSYNYITAP